MAKWSFALLVFLSTGVQANGLSPQVDGCAVLNEIIYEEVTAAGWGITHSDLVFTNFNEPSVVVCMNTAQTASNAYSSAIRTLGGDVSWESTFDYPEDVCLSGFLEQCMPRDERSPGSLSTVLTFSRWQAISDAVTRAMPDGSAADRSIFSTRSMRLAVRAALR